MVARYLQEQSSGADAGSLLMGFLDFYGNHVRNYYYYRCEYRKVQLISFYFFTLQRSSILVPRESASGNASTLLVPIIIRREVRGRPQCGVRHFWETLQSSKSAGIV